MNQKMRDWAKRNNPFGSRRETGEAEPTPISCSISADAPMHSVGQSSQSAWADAHQQTHQHLSAQPSHEVPLAQLIHEVPSEAPIHEVPSGLPNHTTPSAPQQYHQILSAQAAAKKGEIKLPTAKDLESFAGQGPLILDPTTGEVRVGTKPNHQMLSAQPQHQTHSAPLHQTHAAQPIQSTIVCSIPQSALVRVGQQHITGHAQGTSHPTHGRPQSPVVLKRTVTSTTDFNGKKTTMTERPAITPTATPLTPTAPPTLHLQGTAAGREPGIAETKWSDKFKKLISNPDTLFGGEVRDFFDDFDEYLKKDHKVDNLRQNIEDICQGFIDKFQDSRGDASPVFFWHFLSRTVQYYETSLKKTVGKKMPFFMKSVIITWTRLAETPDDRLEELKIAQVRLLQPYCTNHIEYFFGTPLHNLLESASGTENRALAWMSRLVGWGLSPEEHYAQIADKAVNMFGILTLVSRVTPDLRFAWKPFLLKARTLSEKVPDHLLCRLAEKRNILPEFPSDEQLVRFAATCLNVQQLDILFRNHAGDPQAIWQDRIEDIARLCSPTLEQWQELVQCKLPHSSPQFLSQCFKIAMSRFYDCRLMELIENFVLTLGPSDVVEEALCSMDLRSAHTTLDALQEFAQSHCQHELFTCLFEVHCKYIRTVHRSLFVEQQMLQLASLASYVPINKRSKYQVLRLLLETILDFVHDPKEDAFSILQLVLRSEYVCSVLSVELTEDDRFYLKQMILNAAPSPDTFLLKPSVSGDPSNITRQWAESMSAFLEEALAGQTFDRITTHCMGEWHDQVTAFVLHLDQKYQTNKPVASWFDVALVLRALDPVLEDFEISSLTNLSHFPRCFQCLGLVAQFKGQLAQGGSVPELSESWGYRWQAFARFENAVWTALNSDPEQLTWSQFEVMAGARSVWEELKHVLFGPMQAQITNDVFDRSGLDAQIKQVQELHHVLHWLESFNVVGVADLVGNFSLDEPDITVLLVRRHREQVKMFLQPLNSRMPLIRHCLESKSFLFNSAMRDQVQGEDFVDVATVKQWLCEADRLLQSLLKNEIPLGSAKELIKDLKGASIREEVEKLTSFEGYNEWRGSPLLESIETALAMIHHSTCAKHIVKLVDQFDLIREPSGDADLAHICEEQRTQDDRPLNQAADQFRHFTEIFTVDRDSLNELHFRLFVTVSRNPLVVTFFRDNDYLSARGLDRFEQAKNNLTVALRGQNVENHILNDVIEVHRIIEPFVQSSQSLRHFIRKVLALPNLSQRHLDCIDSVNTNIGFVRRWFSEVSSSTTENAEASARAILSYGRVEMNLRALQMRKSDLHLCYDVEKTQVRLNESEMRELMQQLAFCGKSLAEGQGHAAGDALTCLSRLRAAMGVWEELGKLEASGHSQFQARTVVLPLRETTVEELNSEADNHRRNVKAWRKTLHDTKVSQHPLLAIFENRELLVMSVLADRSHACRCAVIELMRGPVQWPLDATQKQSMVDQLAAECLATFARSSCGFASLRVDDAELAKKIAAFCKRQFHGDSIVMLGTFVEELLKPSPPEHAGKSRQQFVANLATDGDSVEHVQEKKLMTILSLLYHLFYKEQSWSPRSIMWCDITTTENEMDAFLQRVEAFPKHTFALIGLNKMQPSLQQRVWDFQKQLHRSRQAHACIYYVYDNVTAVPTAEYLQVYELPRILSLNELITQFQGRRHPFAGRITAVCGLSGIGKTESIKKKVSADSPCISLMDQLDARRVQAALASMTTAEQTVRIVISEHANFLEVNTALFNLFVCGVWCNYPDGTVYAPRQTAAHYIVEVPYCNVGINPKEDMRLRYPVLLLCGSVEEVTGTSELFTIGEDERIVAQYLDAATSLDVQGRTSINRLCKDDDPVEHPPVTDDNQCRDLIQQVYAQSARQRARKRHQQCFVKYLRRRFEFFRSSIYYRYNKDHQMRLGITAYEQMLKEATMLCSTDMVCCAAGAPASMLVYGDEFSLNLFESRHDPPTHQLKRLVVDWLQRQKTLGTNERCAALLAWTMNLQDSEVIELCRSERFVLVNDFVFKIICINERRLIEMPVIIEGLTGVGKTFVLQFYARLLNYKLLKKDSDEEVAPRVIWRVKFWLREKVLPRLRDQERARRLKSELLEEDWDEEKMLGLWAELLQAPLNAEPCADTAVEAAQRTGAAAAPITRAALIPIPVSAAAPSTGAAPGTGAAEPVCENRANQTHSLIEMLFHQVPLWLAEAPLLESSPQLIELLGPNGVVSPTDDAAQDLMRSFLDSKVREVFYRLLCHPDIQMEDIEAFLNPIIDTARLAPQATLVVLFDELNTSSVLGFLKAVIVDHSLHGQDLPRNIFFVGCINPHTKVERPKDRTVLTAHREEYFVHELPASMVELRWQYPPLEYDELQEFVLQKLELQAPNVDTFIRGRFAQLICKCQQFLGQKVGSSAVSQRDIQRCLVVFDFFWSFLDHSTSTLNDKLFRCMALALATVYYFRLSSEWMYGIGDSQCSGAQLQSEMQSFMREALSIDFKQEVDAAVNSVINERNFRVPAGIALNRDLKENLFVMVVCVETKIPVCILGAPGRSKTLAFEVLMQNLRGPNSHTPFCRRLKAIDPFIYQCSSESTAREIEIVLNRAIEREKIYVQSGGHERCTLFLDEGGLPEDSKMAMKALHDALDEYSISVIVASNRPLDAANQGRMLTMVRPQQSLEDYELLAAGILYPQKDRENLPTRVQDLIRGLAAAFMHIRTDDVFGSDFSDRDFIYLLRYLHLNCVKAGKVIRPLDLLRALESNFFSSSGQFNDIVSLFFSFIASTMNDDFAMPPESSFRSTLEVVRACLQGGGDGRERAEILRSENTHLAPRFCAVLDRTEDDGAARLLVQERLVPEGIEVIHVPNMEDDVDEVYSAECISRMKHCMEVGTPVLLRNAGRVMTSFYNLFNQNYRVTEAREVAEETARATADDSPTAIAKLLYVIVARGARTYHCRVDPKFFLVLHMRASEFQSQPSALRSRFCKVELNLKDALEARVISQFPREKESLNIHRVFEKCRELVKCLGEHAFVGLCAEHTLKSLCLASLPLFHKSLVEQHKVQEFAPCCDGDLTVHPGSEGVVQTLAIRLLQLVPPEHMLQCATKFGNASFYRKAYFKHQNHFSLPSLLRTVLENDQCQKPKLLIHTRTSGDMLGLLKLEQDSDIWKTSDRGRISVLDVEKFQSPVELNAAFMERLAVQGEDKVAAVILTVDMHSRGNEHVTWLRDVIDQQAHARKDVLFVLLLHYPPEVIISGRLYPCIFLDNWDFFFLDSLGRQTVFREDYLTEMLCGEGITDLPSAVNMDESVKVFVSDFCRRVRLDAPQFQSEVSPTRRSWHGSLYGWLAKVFVPEDVVGKFYKNDCSFDDRTCALQQVIYRHPEIWRQLVGAFHETCSSRDLRPKLELFASEIRSGKRLMSLMESAFLHLHEHFRCHAISFLRIICNNFGLLAFEKDQSSSIALLLRLMPKLPMSRTLQNVVQIQCNTSITGFSPLFGMLQQHLEGMCLMVPDTKNMALDKINEQQLSQALADQVENDKCLREFCKLATAETMKEYINFLMSLGSGGLELGQLVEPLQQWVLAGVDGDPVGVQALAKITSICFVHQARLARLAKALELLSKMCQDYRPPVGPPGTTDDAVDEWRTELESKVFEKLFLQQWENLLGFARATEEQQDQIDDWANLHAQLYQLQHRFPTASNHFPNVSKPNKVPQKLRCKLQAMTLVSIVFNSLDKDHSLAIVRRLCASLTEHGDHFTVVWFFQQLSDLSQGDMQLFRKLIVPLLMQCLHDDRMEVTKDVAREFLICISGARNAIDGRGSAERGAGAAEPRADSNGERPIPEAMELLLISRIKERVSGGSTSWSEVCQQILQGMPLPYQHSCARAADVTVPWLADLLFTLMVTSSVEFDNITNRNLTDAYMRAARPSGGAHQPHLLSVEVAAHEFIFVRTLARRLCQANRAADITKADFERGSEFERVDGLIQAASSNFLSRYQAPFFVEVNQRRGIVFLEELLSNQSLHEVIPTLRDWQGSVNLVPPVANNLFVTLPWTHPTFLVADELPDELSMFDGVAEICNTLSVKLNEALNARDVEPLQNACANLIAQSDVHKVRGSLLLCIYHGFYSSELNPRIQPLLQWLPQLDLNLSTVEMRCFQMLIQPAGFQYGYSNASNSVNRLFQLGNQDPSELMARHCLVNLLACLILLPPYRRAHLWTCFTEPQTLKGTFGFGSTYHVEIGSVHYDCGCVFQLDGTLKFGNRSPHLPAHVAVAAYFQCYGCFCLHFLMNQDAGVNLCDKVLSRHAMVAARQGQEDFLDMHGADTTDQTANFCYQRVVTACHFLNTRLDMNQEQLSFLLNRTTEHLVAVCSEPTNPFRTLYRSVDERTAAEKEFRDIFTDELQQLPQCMQQCGLGKFQEMLPFRPTFDNFALALGSAKPTPMIRLLQLFNGSRVELCRVQLLPAMLRLCNWLHKDLGEHLRGSMTEEDAACSKLHETIDRYLREAVRDLSDRQRLKNMVDKGCEAFNEFHAAMEGNLEVGACGDEQSSFEAVNKETSLLYFIRPRGANENPDMLFRAIELLMQVRQTYLDSVEQISQEENVPAVFRQVCIQKGDSKLQKIMPTSALELECRLVDDNFQELAAASLQRRAAPDLPVGEFDFELVCQHVLQFSVLGKSDFNPDDVRCEFELAAQTSPTLEQSVAALENSNWDLPPYFCDPPDPDKREDLIERLRTFSHADVLHSIEMLSTRAVEVVRKWPVSEANTKESLSERLIKAGLELPKALSEALNGGPPWYLCNFCDLLRVLVAKLGERDFAFVHVPSALRRPLNDCRAKHALDSVTREYCRTASDADTALSILKEHEDHLLHTESEPIKVVLCDLLSETNPFLKNLHESILGRHLMTVYLKLLEVRVELASALEQTQEVKLWWESVPNVNVQSDHEGEVIQQAEDMRRILPEKEQPQVGESVINDARGSNDHVDSEEVPPAEPEAMMPENQEMDYVMLEDQSMFTFGVEENLEIEQQEFLQQAKKRSEEFGQNRAALIIQRSWRRMQDLRFRSAVSILAMLRGHVQRQRYKHSLRSAVLIQATFRRHAQLQRCKRSLRSAVLIQATFRRHLQLQRDKRQKLLCRVAVSIQAIFRRHMQHQRYKRQKLSAHRIQRLFRQHAMRRRFREEEEERRKAEEEERLRKEAEEEERLRKEAEEEETRRVEEEKPPAADAAPTPPPAATMPTELPPEVLTADPAAMPTELPTKVPTDDPATMPTELPSDDPSSASEEVEEAANIRAATLSPVMSVRELEDEEQPFMQLSAPPPGDADRPSPQPPKINEQEAACCITRAARHCLRRKLKASPRVFLSKIELPVSLGFTGVEEEIDPTKNRKWIVKYNKVDITNPDFDEERSFRTSSDRVFRFACRDFQICDDMVPDLTLVSVDGMLQELASPRYAQLRIVPKNEIVHVQVSTEQGPLTTYDFHRTAKLVHVGSRAAKKQGEEELFLFVHESLQLLPFGTSLSTFESADIHLLMVASAEYFWSISYSGRRLFMAQPASSCQLVRAAAETSKCTEPLVLWTNSGRTRENTPLNELHAEKPKLVKNSEIISASFDMYGQSLSMEVLRSTDRSELIKALSRHPNLSLPATPSSYSIMVGSHELTDGQAIADQLGSEDSAGVKILMRSRVTGFGSNTGYEVPLEHGQTAEAVLRVLKARGGRVLVDSKLVEIPGATELWNDAARYVQMSLAVTVAIRIQLPDEVAERRPDELAERRPDALVERRMSVHAGMNDILQALKPEYELGQRILLWKHNGSYLSVQQANDTRAIDLLDVEEPKMVQLLQGPEAGCHVCFCSAAADELVALNIELEGEATGSEFVMLSKDRRMKAWTKRDAHLHDLLKQVTVFWHLPSDLYCFQDEDKDEVDLGCKDDPCSLAEAFGNDSVVKLHLVPKVVKLYPSPEGEQGPKVEAVRFHLRVKDIKPHSNRCDLPKPVARNISCTSSCLDLIRMIRWTFGIASILRISSLRVEKSAFDCSSEELQDTAVQEIIDEQVKEASDADLIFELGNSETWTVAISLSGNGASGRSDQGGSACHSEAPDTSSLPSCWK